MEATTTGLVVAGIGAAVSAVGATLMKKSRFGAGMLGFGLAHVALGLLDGVRPSVRD